MAILTGPLNLNNEIQPNEIPLPPQLPADDSALKLVLKDLNRAEYYLLAKGMSVEWDKDDRLYLFRMPQAFWEGSSVPRSSLGIPLIYEHIESLLPQIMAALFSDEPPFLCNPRPGTTAETARAVKSILAKQLKDMGFREEARLGIKESMCYTAGIWKWGWRRYKKTRRVYEYEGPAELEGTDAGPITKPTKKSRKVVEKLEDYWVNEPYIEKLHIRHVIVSPDLRVPDIRKAKYVIHRMYMTLQDLEKLRDQPGYSLPKTEDLAALFFPPKETPERSLLEGRNTTSVLNTGISSLDINMEFKAMPRWQDPSTDPTLQPLEVLEYTSEGRSIVVLNRKLTIKNDVNEFGKINFLSINYTDVLDSFYGIGVAKLLSGEQRLQQGVINSRLDDLALRLSGTFLRKRGANTPTQQLRLRPGGIIDSDDEKGVQMIQYPPAIVDAFTEIEASDARSQRRTGANDIVTQGNIGQPSSVTRTASGMQTLSAGVGARMGYFVDFICDLFFVPALEAFHEMNARWLESEDIHEILSEELGDAWDGDALDVKNANCKFNMLAGSKVRAKQALMQIFQPMIQFLTAAPVMDALTDQGKKIDFAEAAQQWLDLADWPGSQSLIVELTDEDKKRLAAKNEAMIQMSQLNQKHRNTMEEIEQKGLSQAGTHVIKGVVDELTGANQPQGPNGTPAQAQ